MSASMPCTCVPTRRFRRRAGLDHHDPGEITAEFTSNITTAPARPLSPACVARGRFVKPAAEHRADSSAAHGLPRLVGPDFVVVDPTAAGDARDALDGHTDLGDGVDDGLSSHDELSPRVDRRRPKGRPRAWRRLKLGEGRTGAVAADISVRRVQTRARSRARHDARPPAFGRAPRGDGLRGRTLRPGAQGLGETVPGETETRRWARAASLRIQKTVTPEAARR